MKFCYRCGVQLADDFEFCPVCGEKQVQISEAPAPQSVAQEVAQTPAQPVPAPVQPIFPYVSQPVTTQPEQQRPSQPVQAAPQIPVQQIPVQQIPVQQIPVYYQPQPYYVYPTAPKPAPKKSDGKTAGKLGLAAGIVALASGLFLCLETILYYLVANWNLFLNFEYTPIVALTVLGIVFSSIARKRGNRKAGSLLGLIFSICGGVLLILGCILILFFNGFIGGGSGFTV